MLFSEEDVALWPYSCYLTCLLRTWDALQHFLVSYVCLWYACDIYSHCWPPTIFILTKKAKFFRKNCCKLFNSNCHKHVRKHKVYNIKPWNSKKKKLQRIAKYIQQCTLTPFPFVCIRPQVLSSHLISHLFLSPWEITSLNVWFNPRQSSADTLGRSALNPFKWDFLREVVECEALCEEKVTACWDRLLIHFWLGGNITSSQINVRCCWIFFIPHHIWHMVL